MWAGTTNGKWALGRSSWVGLFLALALSACSEAPFPIEYESEHFRYGSGLDRPLCEGDLRYYEALAQRATTTLGLPLDGVTDVYIWKDTQWGPAIAEEFCADALVGGCYSPDSRTIHTQTQSLTHEIIHAAVDARNVPVFINEGIAEAFSGAQTRFANTLPSSNLGGKSSEIDLLTATHFVHWLLETRGPDKLGSFIGRGEDLHATFEAVYGLSLTEAELDYLAEAPAAYPAIGSCDGIPLAYDETARTWSFRDELACAGEATRANYLGLYTTRSVTIDEPGRYNLDIGAGTWIQGYACTTEAVEALLTSEEAAALDFPPDWTGFPDGSARLILGPHVGTVELEPGTYVLRVGVEGYAAGMAELALWPSPSPTTEVPGG